MARSFYVPRKDIMGKTSVNPPKTPVTKGSSGIAAATVPNVCKMPGPPAPFVPTPLPNIARSATSPKGFTKKVKIDGQIVAIKGATFKSMGDIASKGTGGGLVSATVEGVAKFIGPGSLDVKAEGKSIHLLAEPMLNNCGGSGNPPNSATMMGLVQGPGSPGKADDALCLWCGKPLEGHESLKTDDKRMNDEASQQKQRGGAKTFGAMKTGDGSVIQSQSGGGDGKLFNLKYKREIPMNAAQKKALEAKGNTLGNCCEQKMLRREFGPGGAGFPPPGGIGSIKMGIVESVRGDWKRVKKKDRVKKKPKCGTCVDVLKMMLCTDPPAPPPSADAS